MRNSLIDMQPSLPSLLPSLHTYIHNHVPAVWGEELVGVEGVSAQPGLGDTEAQLKKGREGRKAGGREEGR
jgi:hypothetical protein